MRRKLAGFVALVLCVLFVQPLIADDNDRRDRARARRKDENRRGRQEDARDRHPEAGRGHGDRDRYRGDHYDNRNRNRDRYDRDYRHDRRWSDRTWRRGRSRLSFNFYFGNRPYWEVWYRPHYVCVPGRWAYDRYADDEYWVDGYCYDPRMRYSRYYYYGRRPY